VVEEVEVEPVEVEQDAELAVEASLEKVEQASLVEQVEEVTAGEVEQVLVEAVEEVEQALVEAVEEVTVEEV
jgi:hypothetical protein